MVGVIGKPKAGFPNGTMLSVGDRDVYNPQDRLRQILAATWHSASSD